MNKNIGLYVHVPFCVRKCAYCDFYSISNGALHEKYVNALAFQMKTLSKFYFDRVFDTVYIGGGTPTALSCDNISKLLKSVNESFNISDDCEFTIEANPATVDGKKLSALLENGVNRLSIGLQSAHKNELEILGRLHSFEDFKENVLQAKNAGFENVSADIMYAIPRQTKDSLLETINKIADLGLTHISMYGLKIEENTLFYKKRNTLEFPNEDDYCEMYESACEKLNSLGYSRYEISNFSKKGFESRHNLRYWNIEEYLGIGPGAHSFVDLRRYSYERDINRYINSIENKSEPPLSEDRLLSPNDIKNEAFMLGMRLENGIDLNDFDFVDREKISFYEKHGFLEINKDNLRFTSKGFLVSNYILSELIDFE